MAIAFKYTKGDTFIHKLDVRTKLAMVMFHTIAVLLIWDLRVLVLFLLLGIFWLFSAKIDWSNLKKPFAALVILLVIVTVATDMFYPTIAVQNPHILYQWGPIAIAYESIIYAITVTFRYLSIFPIASLFILTTDPSKLTISLSKIKIPYKLAFAVNIALRYLPTLLVDYQIISNAQKARGFELEKPSGGFIEKIKRAAPIMIPMLLLGIKRAEQVADAMDLRGFGAFKKRTWLYETKMHLRDYAMLSFYMGLVLASIYLRLYVIPSLWIPPLETVKQYLWIPLFGG